MALLHGSPKINISISDVYIAIPKDSKISCNKNSFMVGGRGSPHREEPH